MARTRRAVAAATATAIATATATAATAATGARGSRDGRDGHHRWRQAGADVRGEVPGGERRRSTPTACAGGAIRGGKPRTTDSLLAGSAVHAVDLTANAVIGGIDINVPAGVGSDGSSSSGSGSGERRRSHPPHPRRDPLADGGEAGNRRGSMRLGHGGRDGGGRVRVFCGVGVG